MIEALFLAASLIAQNPVTTLPPEPESPDLASESACFRAAALEDARISAPIPYDLGIDLRIVDGLNPQTAMPGARTRLICLYNRGTGRAETRPFDPALPLSYSRQVRGVWWHAVEMAGAPVANAELLTLSLGSDGRIVGRSGCNLYSAMYRLDGDTLEVIWPMTGTRRACLPAFMDQELRFREILLRARSARLQDDGTLLVTDRDGRSLRFRRAEAEMRPTTGPVIDVP